MAAAQPESAVQVLQSAASVAAALSPIRLELLKNLREADSASGLARRLGLPRQKVNYHLRELERGRLVELVEERQRRGCTERRVRITARAFVVSPTLLGELSREPVPSRDRFSSAFLVDRAARLVDEVGRLRRAAEAAEQTLITATLEAEVEFESPAALKAFAEELAVQVARLAERHRAPPGNEGRRYRFVMGAHPALDNR